MQIITEFSLGDSTHKRFKKAKDNVAVDPVSNKPYITHEYTNGQLCSKLFMHLKGLVQALSVISVVLLDRPR